MPRPDNTVPWWLESDEEKLAASAIDEVHRILHLRSDAQNQIVENYCYYGAFSSPGTSNDLVEWLPEKERLANNVIANAVDSLAAELTQTIARPMVVSTGGTWDEFNRARQLTSYLDLEFDHHGADLVTIRVVLDGLICGTGASRWVPHGDKVRLDRILPEDVLADDRACSGRMPRAFYLRLIVDKYELAAQYEDDEPDKAKAILDGGISDMDRTWAQHRYGDTDDLVSLYEGWRLGKGGRRFVAIDGTALSVDDYTDETPPISFFRPMPPARGWFGEVPIDRVKGVQLELNKLNRRIQDSMHIHSRVITFVARAAQIAKDQLTNALASVIEYSGNQPPVFNAPHAMGADVYQFRGGLKSEVYEGLGHNEMAAQGTIPRGMENSSGVAIELFNDTGSRRFINQKRYVDEYEVDSAKKRIALLRADPGKILIKRRGVVQAVKASDVLLPEDAHHIAIQPTGSLPKQPQGKALRLEGMVKARMLTPDEAIEISDDPDTERVRAIRLAPIELLEQSFEDMLGDGESEPDADAYQPPEPQWPLKRGIALCIQYLALAQKHGVVDSRLQLLRDWYAKAVEYETAAAGANAPPLPPLPPGGPMMPPLDPMMGGGLVPPGMPPMGGPPMPPPNGMPMPPGPPLGMPMPPGVPGL